MRRLLGLVSVVAMMAAMLLPVAQWVAAAEGHTVRVSVSSDGDQANEDSGSPSVSADGRFVAFESEASNLAVGDANNAWDVFVHDRETGATSLVSMNGEGEPGNGHSRSPSVSADGRFVAFESDASNLVAGDTNDTWDVFVHDRNTDETERISVSSEGTQGTKASTYSSISADGRFVAFRSEAAELVAGDTNGWPDVFVHDRDTGETERVSVSSAGDQGDFSSAEPSISSNGRFVAFYSFASNLVAEDTNNALDVFVHDRETGETERVSVSSVGAQANASSVSPAISGDGRLVAFRSWASNLVDDDTNDAAEVFAHDRESGITERVSVSSDGTQANGASFYPSMSGDGRFVAFYSDASNLVSGDANGYQDVFVLDRDTDDVLLVSVSSDVEQGNFSSGSPSVSADGRFVSFYSSATNLVAGDNNEAWDVFMHQIGSDLPPATTTTSTTTTTMPETSTTTTTMPEKSTTSTAPPTPSTSEPPATEPPSTEPPTTTPNRHRFSDVPEAHRFYADIEWLAAEGITVGCNPPENTMFCPGDSVSRGQMAAFLTRALGLAEKDVDSFVDDETSVFEDDINSIAGAGIAIGCNPPANSNFCANDNVSRQQMASFLVRAYRFTDDGPETDRFVDDDFSVHEEDIETLASFGVTFGCNPPGGDRYCPLDDVTRDQMAAFLQRAERALR